MISSRQTKLKLRKGFEGAPLFYRVLMVQQFTDADRKIIAKGLIHATTPDKAKPLLPQPNDHLLQRDKRSKFRMLMMQTTHGGNFDINILTYKGLEVALYYKRQTSTVTPEPEDPAPEGYIENEDDLWVRLDLFSKSPRQLVGSVREELLAKDAEIQRLRIANETYEDVHGADVRLITTLRSQLKDATSKPVGKKSGRKK